MAAETKLVISGDARGALSAVKRLEGELGGLQALAAKAFNFSSLAGVAAIGTITAALVSLTREAINTGDRLAKMSQKTGIAVEDLSKLQYAAELSAVSTEALQKGLTSLAVGIVEVADGKVSVASEQLKKFGIEVRNTDGTMKSSRQVLGELADQFALMPNGIEKTNAAAAIFGKRIGADLIPLLNGGSKGLQAMGDEAERLGAVMSTELAKKSEEFNDNLERLSKLSAAAGQSIAVALVPELNRLAATFLDARYAGLGFGEALLGIGLSDPTKSPAEHIARITKEIEELKKSAQSTSKLDPFLPWAGYAEKTIAGLEKQRKYFELQQKRQTGDGIESAKELASKRIAIEKQMQVQLEKLAKLRAIAEGEISDDILDKDDKRTAAQIKNAENLKKALVDAWRTSLKEAEDAGKEAQKLFDQASGVRQKASDDAAEKVRSTLTPEEQQAELGREYYAAKQAAQSALDSANYSQSLSNLARLNHRLQNADNLAKQANEEAKRASDAAERASQFAGQLKNPEDPTAGANAIKQAAEIKAQALEVQGRGKQQEQKNLEEQAASQQTLINELDQQLTELQNKAASIKVEADIADATNELATLKAQLDNIKDKTVTVTVNTIQAGGGSGTSAAGATGEFARGGYTGPGGKWQPAGIVHAGEFVLRQEVVRQRGALSLLTRLNRMGMSAIPGYAHGGLVNKLRMPSISAAPSAAASPANNLTLVMPGMGSYQLHAEADVLGVMQSAFAREALKKGARR